MLSVCVCVWWLDNTLSWNENVQVQSSGQRKTVNVPSSGLTCRTPCGTFLTDVPAIMRWPDGRRHLIYRKTAGSDKPVVGRTLKRSHEQQRSSSLLLLPLAFRARASHVAIHRTEGVAEVCWAPCQRCNGVNVPDDWPNQPTSQQGL